MVTIKTMANPEVLGSVWRLQHVFKAIVPVKTISKGVIAFSPNAGITTLSNGVEILLMFEKLPRTQ